MSNCIDIVQGGEVAFMYDEIDIPAFRRLLASAKQCDYAGTPSPKELAADVAYWYLSTAWVTDYKVVINFGWGRSSHTTRSFRATLIHLSKLIKKKKFHTFYVTDEGDGHEQVYKWSVDFKSLLGL